VAVLTLPRPYDFLLSTERFRAFGPDLANLWDGEALLRAVGGREVRIAAAPGGVDVEPLDAEIAPDVRKLLGAELDLGGFARFAAGADPVLARLAKVLAGFRPPLAPDPFEALVGSITAQQVSLFAAFAVRSRLIERFGTRVGRVCAFPARDRLAAAEPEELTALGFSRRKAEYTLTLARSDVDLDGLAALDDDEVRARLVALPGIGEWTVDWFLARHLARPRAWPAGDLGLRKAVSAFYADGRALGTDEVRDFGARFEPWQNLTAHYLLTGLRVSPPA
jgi:3-methyladenine DNA glycosylase/8-oxoguanine DNA glycosylase